MPPQGKMVEQQHPFIEHVLGATGARGQKYKQDTTCLKELGSGLFIPDLTPVDNSTRPYILGTNFEMEDYSKPYSQKKITPNSNPRRRPCLLTKTSE